MHVWQGLAGEGMTPSRLLAKAKPSPWQSPFPLQGEGLEMTGRHYDMVDRGASEG